MSFVASLPVVAAKGVGYILAFSLVAFPIGALLQEKKAFKDTGLGVVGSVRAFVFIQVSTVTEAAQHGRRHACVGSGGRGLCWGGGIGLCRPLRSCLGRVKHLWR